MRSAEETWEEGLRLWADRWHMNPTASGIAFDKLRRIIRTAQREAAAEALEEQARQAENAMECAREDGKAAYSRLWGYVAKKLSRRARQYREEAGREG